MAGCTSWRSRRAWSSSVLERTGDSRVSVVRLRVGRLSGVVPDALQFCFELAAAGTPLEGATLEIADERGRAHCRSCGTDFDLDDLFLLCECGSADVDAAVRTELSVTSVEVADMCSTCGCGDGRRPSHDAGARREQRHQHDHADEHDAPARPPARPTTSTSRARPADPAVRTHTLELEVAVLAKNDELAARNRAWLTDRGSPRST